jgi:hypothetical protein
VVITILLKQDVVIELFCVEQSKVVVGRWSYPHYAFDIKFFLVVLEVSAFYTVFDLIALPHATHFYYKGISERILRLCK